MKRARKHSQIVYVDIDGIEVEIDCTYTFTSGVPEQGPSYASGGQPAEGPEIEILDMFVKGDRVPDWFYKAVINGEKALDYIAENHEPEEPPERERGD